MDSFVISNLGDRDNNEDSAGVFTSEINGEKCTVYVLADGLGGHGKGEVASGLAVRAAREVLESSESTDEIIERIFEKAQADILEKQKIEHAESAMKTTMVVLFEHNGHMKWGHVGDSRLYMFKNNKYEQRTLDHSIPQMLVLSGELKEKKIRNHPDRNKLLRVLGDEWDRAKYEISEEIELTGGEAFLLCSDGFWENITEKQMEKMLKKKGTAEEILKLMDQVVQKQGRKKDLDNNTAVLIKNLDR